MSNHNIQSAAFTNLASLDSVIEEGGKPSSNGTSTGTATDETASATSSGQGPTSTSGSDSSEQGNSGRLLSAWSFNHLVTAFVFFGML